MIDGQLITRKTWDDPPGYRVVFDDGTGTVEVGSISERTRRTQQNERYWRWGVDTMPLMDQGGRPPSGETWSREAALQAFKAAFLKWVNGLHPGDWQRNRDHIKTGVRFRK